jgi:hypothetical protein
MLGTRHSVVVGVASAALLILALPASDRAAAQTSDASVHQPTKVAQIYRTPRTAWGDPNIAGNYTNIDEVATPLERPDEFKGRRLEDIKGEELARIRYNAQFALKNRFDNDNGIHAQTSFWGWDPHGQGNQAWLIVDPPEGKIPALTPDGRARADMAQRQRQAIASRFATDYRDYTLYDRCITRGLPGSMMPAMYGDSYRIVQGPGYVAIQYEMVHETRLIPLDGRPHAGKRIRFDMGDARGHWEGETLVVDTTNFTDRSAYRNSNGATLRIVERFTPVAPDRLKWQVTVDDPATWTRPWTIAMPLRMDDREAILEYSCHEGNVGLRDLISIASTEQSKADELVRRGLTPAPRAANPGGE